MKNLKILPFLIGLTLSTDAPAVDWSEYYSVENIPSPAEVDPQYGGVLALANGKVAACFNSGEVQIYDPKKASWKPFARGLHCPLGVIEEEDGSLLVMQWSELTRLKDSDSDGEADVYETVFNDFGVTGNYHEFAYGPARDPQGNLYISLNVASNFAGTFKNVRGPFSKIGCPPETLTQWGDDPKWKKNKLKAGRMFSRVPYRGCVLKITPDGKGSVFAYGFRSPDGIGFDDQGRLWVTDNQGDWRGTSPLYHVTEGNFYGHPASLVWKDGWTRDPLEMPVPELERMRTRAAGLFPQGELANSPTQPIPTIDPELFGLPKGELLIGEMNQPTLIRFLPEKVGGVTQGCMIPFLKNSGLGIGNHRLSFSDDGTLWVGKTHLKWAGDEGMRRVCWRGEPMLIANRVSLRKNGFEIGFNRPLGDKVPDVAVSRHTYHYHSKYGSEKVDLKEIEVLNTVVAEDRKSLRFTIPEVDSNHLYTIEINHAADTDGRPLMGSTLRYNVISQRTGHRNNTQKD